MITTNEGVRIEFERLDEWVITMRVGKKSHEGAEISITAVLTIQNLISEINLLQRAKPKLT